LKLQSERLGIEPIPRLLANLTIPATVGMLAMAMHSVIDAIFIARGVGTIGVAAVAITFPLTMIIMATGGAIGIGGASVISRALGAGSIDKANLALGNIIAMIIAISAAFLLVGINYLNPMLRLFGASDNILPYSCEYLVIILYGTIFFTFSFVMNNIVRAEGNARVAMATMIMSSFLNIIFTAIFMFGFKLGMSGAAYGTVSAQGVTSLFLFGYYAFGHSTLSMKLGYLRIKTALVREILAVGMSAFVRQGASSVMLIIANNLLVFYGGDLAIAVLGIIHRVMMFTLMPVLGVVQGLLPLVGFNYGAKKKLRVNESIVLGMKVATVISFAGFLIVMAFPTTLMKIFTDDPALLEMGVPALRIMFALTVTVGMQMITGGVFQALGKAKEAFVMSMARQILFLIPLMLVLPLFLGLNGVWLAFPAADIFSFILAIWLIRRHKDYFFLNGNRVLAVSK
jgi:putative MATE family efflux protein